MLSKLQGVYLSLITLHVSNLLAFFMVLSLSGTFISSNMMISYQLAAMEQFIGCYLLRIEVLLYYRWYIVTFLKIAADS